MGATQSKSSSTEKELKAANILDILATKYILTQNFQDMKKLGDKEYCNKLVILTADIIKKFLKEKEITYIAQRVVDGVPVNRLYKRCRFYWHKRTSKHNRKLCSAAQLLKNDKEKNKGKKLPKGKKFTGGV